MRFIVDAQLPRKLAVWLRAKGYDAIHTLELPEKNLTTDEEISRISISDKRIVISKDSDFYDRYFNKLEPYKLIFLTTGNIRTNDLIEIFEKNLSTIIFEISNNSVIELTRINLIVIA
jgi:predicted nuclease of predicted toxin-antitoxin system